MKVLRTPDERFINLKGYPFEPNYKEVPDGEGGRLRIHYIDEGPPNGRSGSADPWRTELVLSLPEDDPHFG